MGNLRKHLMSRHADEWRVIDLNDKKLEAEKKVKEGTLILPIEFSEKILIDACVELVTVDGRPFSLMNDGGFKKLLDPYLNAIGKKLTITPVTIRQKVIDKADYVRQSIRDEVKVRIINDFLLEYLTIYPLKYVSLP